MDVFSQLTHMKESMLDLLAHFTIPKAASWVVRKILESRTSIMESSQLQGDLHDRLHSVCKQNRFNIQKLYLSLIPSYTKVTWKTLLLIKNMLPRHKFTVWLAAHHRLPTVDRLQTMGLQIPVACVFCQQNVENFNHLFFECSITNRIWSRICIWLGYSRTIGCWGDELMWIYSKANSNRWRNAITASAFITTVALIWRVRNHMRFEGATFVEELIYKEIALLIHLCGRNCRQWQDGLRQLNYYP